MADEQHKWLDRGAAERLLRGEPLEAVAPEARPTAGRLAEALAALSTGATRADAELPGENAALAAFREARAEADCAAAASAGRARAHGSSPAGDVCLVRFEQSAPAVRRARWGRSLRLGLAAGLTAGMLGGVAVAVGAGALPTPFRDDRPRPGASVSAAVPPERPLMSPSPDDSGSGRDGGSASGSGGSPDAGEGAGDGTAREDSPEDSPESSTGGQPDSRDSAGQGQGESGTWWSAVLSACRDVDQGRTPDLGSRRSLENAAGGSGPGRLKKYCDRVLNSQGHDSGTPGAAGESEGNETYFGPDKAGEDKGGRDDEGDQGDQDDQDDQDDQGRDKGGDKSGDRGKGGHGNGARWDRGGKGDGGDGEGGGTPGRGNDHRPDGGRPTPASTSSATAPDLRLHDAVADAASFSR